MDNNPQQPQPQPPQQTPPPQKSEVELDADAILRAHGYDAASQPAPANSHRRLIIVVLFFVALCIALTVMVSLAPKPDERQRTTTSPQSSTVAPSSDQTIRLIPASTEGVSYKYPAGFARREGAPNSVIDVSYQSKDGNQYMGLSAFSTSDSNREADKKLTKSLMEYKQDARDSFCRGSAVNNFRLQRITMSGVPADKLTGDCTITDGPDKYQTQFVAVVAYSSNREIRLALLSDSTNTALVDSAEQIIGSIKF